MFHHGKFLRWSDFRLCGEKYLILTTGLILAVLGSKTVLTVLTV